MTSYCINAQNVFVKSAQNLLYMFVQNAIISFVAMVCPADLQFAAEEEIFTVFIMKELSETPCVTIKSII